MSKSLQKKQNQLGMNPSTASGRLVKDLLWDFVNKSGSSSCCKCSKPMSRETFSIEHIIPWLDSDSPIDLFFDLTNISYSHIRCNIADARRTTKTGETLNERNARSQRTVWGRLSKEQQQQNRRDRYKKYGY